MTVETTVSVEEKTRLKPTAKKIVDSKSLIRYRLMIFSRFALAIVGGYGLAAIIAMFLAEMSSTSGKANAVMGATMLAFVVHCAVFIWVFMVRSTLKAWLGIILPIVFFYIAYLLVKGV